MHVQIDWDALLRADEVLVFLYFFTWLVRAILGLIGHAAPPKQP